MINLADVLVCSVTLYPVVAAPQYGSAKDVINLAGMAAIAKVNY